MGFSIALIIIVLIVLYSLARTAGESDRTMEQIREQSLLGRELLFVEVIGVLHTYELTSLSNTVSVKVSIGTVLHTYELTSLSNHCPDRYGHWLVLHTYELTSLSNDAINCFRKGGDLQVLQFNTEDMKKVEKMAKKYGILYSVLPDCNRKDGLSEVIFHTEAVPRVNMMIQKLKFGKIAPFDDYLKNGDEKSLGKLMDFLKKQQGNEKSHTIEGDRVNTAIDGLIEKVGMFAMEKNAISVDQVKENFSINGEQAESVIKQLETIGVLGKKNEDGTHTVMMDKDAFINRVRGYQDLAERMRAVAASKNANLSDVTISKKLIIEENDHAVKTRVPGTWGEEARYVWLRKENIMEIHGGKTMLTFLDSTKDYKLYDEQNRVVTTQKGTELYTHYDKVESSVRERYEKVQKQQKKTAQKKTVTTKKAR